MSSNKIIIIAEAGVNHNGDLDLALQMVDAAAEAGADYIKFQTFNPQLLATATAAKAVYQKKNKDTESQLDMLKQLTLSPKDHFTLRHRCQEQKIGFLSTAFDPESADFLASMHLPLWKIPSGEITDLPMLRKAAQASAARIILSTGMSTLKEVEEAVDALTTAGVPKKNIILLHCTTQYPTPFDQVNLLAMKQLQLLGCGAVGYSDHTPGTEVAVAAAALGAAVIEKHFTLDRSLPGPDQKASLTPFELKQMVEQVRHIEEALGNGHKRVYDAERPNIAAARKSIVAATHIAKGDRLTETNITTKRPGTGLSPMLWDDVIGRHADRDYVPDDQITL